MLVEIWSDIACPFCYIGQRRFAKALRQFEHGAQVEVEWKSFQLNPELKSRPGQKLDQYLSQVKGWTIEQAREINAHVAEMGSPEGIDFKFDNVVLANSFSAHRLIHYAASQGRSNELSARLFRAYFSEGRDIADLGVLAALASDAGLDNDEARAILDSDAFEREVGHDILEARKLGIRAVPTFYINRRLAMAGAQDTSVFLDALRQAWNETPSNTDVSEPLDGSVCSPEGEC
jgi:predicted DsbA family dithiol-disulfide isomerase